MSKRAVFPLRRGGFSALLLLLPIASASPAFGATLGVDDPTSPGVVGDARLSLAEAIRLAGGQLSTAFLSEAERARIDGDPGASSADLIRVDLGEGASLTTPAGATFALPFLIGNDGDVLDGGGAILQPRGGVPSGAFAMITLSSQIEIRRFSFDGYPRAIVVVPTLGAADLEDIRIAENHFSDYYQGVVVVPNQGGSSGLRGLRIEDNRFVAGAGANGAIFLLAGLPQNSPLSSDYVVEDVDIAGNQIDGGFEGITVFGGQATPGTTVRDGRLDGVRIVGNDIRGVFDVSIAVYAGFAFFGGTASGIEVSDVHIAENHIASAGTPSIHIWVVSGTTVFEPGGLVENNVLRDLSIAGNETSGEGCVAGIQLQAGQNEIGAGTVRRNRLEGASLVDNSVAQCEQGIGLFGAHAAAGRGLVEHNELRQVLLFRNRLTDNVRGVIVVGGSGAEGSALPLPSPAPATVRENLVESVDVRANHIRGGVIGMLGIGGFSAFSSDVVIDNSVSSARELGNSVRGSVVRCAAVADVLLGDEGGVATGNRTDFACSPARLPPGP